MRRLPLFLTAILALSLGLAPAAAQAPAPWEDGPYVLWDGPKAQVLQLRQGEAVTAPLGANGQLQLAGLPPLTLSAKAPEPPPCEFPMPVRIAALSDTHGQLDGLVTLLEQHGIMNNQRRWSFGKGHLVVVGDTCDRGPGVTECLWLLRSLQAQADQAGGRVHVLLGNHEAMVLKGDLRYLHPKYQAAPGLLGRDHATLYGATSEQGRWLRSLNIMVRLGDYLFVHGGPSPELAAQAPSIKDLNAQFRQGLRQGVPFPLVGSTGPLWYRGLIPGAAQAGDANDAQVTAILQAFRAKYMVIGHSTQEQITPFHQGRVLGIDANLQTPGHGELWLWEKGKTYRGLLNGTRVPLP